MKLTPAQRALLAKLPPPPSDGFFVTGGSLRAAENLERLALARCVGRGDRGGCFVRTDCWVITVHGWGTLYANGTEQQAEEWRRHKANWEHAVARKRPATVEEITAQTFVPLSQLLDFASTGPAKPRARKT